MANKYLSRGDAPFGDETWEALDSATIKAARSVLAGRRLLHVEGPYGLGLKGVPLADREAGEGMHTAQFAPLTLLQTEFELATRDLAAYERDKTYLDLGPVAEAAIACAQMEDNLIFHGAGGVPGLLTVDGAQKVKLSGWTEVGKAADDIIKAVTNLDEAGFHGPYTLALAPPLYNLLLRLHKQGKMTELDHVKTIVTEGVYKAPALSEGGVLMATGQQFATLVLGQDMTIGFIGPEGGRILFTISESLALLIRQPKAVCVLS